MAQHGFSIYTAPPSPPTNSFFLKWQFAPKNRQFTPPCAAKNFNLLGFYEFSVNLKKKKTAWCTAGQFPCFKRKTRYGVYGRWEKIPKIVSRVWACYIKFSSKNILSNLFFELACRPWRELSNALKKVPWSQREPKSLNIGPHMATLLAQSLGPMH